MVMLKQTTRQRWRLVPGRETITLKSRLTESTFAEFTVHEVKKLPRVKDADDNFRHTTADWLVWQDMLDEAGVTSIKIFDVLLRSDGTTWTVEKATLSLEENCYELSTRKEITSTT